MKGSKGGLCEVFRTTGENVRGEGVTAGEGKERGFVEAWNRKRKYEKEDKKQEDSGGGIR